MYAFDGSVKSGSMSSLNVSTTSSAYTLAASHEGVANKSTRVTAGFVTVDAAPDACLLAPATCASGLSVALWALVASSPAGSSVLDGVALVTTGAPLYPGLGIYIILLPTAGSSSGTLYELVFEARTFCCFHL